MKIVVFEVEAWEQSAFDGLAQRHEVELVPGRLTPETAAGHTDAEIVSVFINSRPTREALDQFDQLKLIATRSTGFDHIDRDYCREHEIAIANVPTYGTNTVAEHVFGLLLTLSHRLYEAIDRTRKGDFSGQGLQGFDLYGKTMGIVGTGDIGRHTASIARGFGMRVLGYDIQPDHESAQRIGFEYVSLDELLAQSDVISLHVPSNEQTHHLINHERFEQMKTGAVLINTARGEVVDINAMVQALAEGKLAGAGLDVLPEEPTIREEAELLRSVYKRSHNLDTLLANHVLLHLRNVVVTPHSAFNTREAIGRILETTVGNIEAFIAGRPENLVNTG